MRSPLSLLVLTASVLAPAPVLAATPITGIDALEEWNLIVLEDLISSSNVEGRTFVGRDLKGTSSDYQKNTPAPSVHGTPGLTVVGNVTGNHKNLNNGSGANVGGNVDSGFNLNGAVQTVNVGGSIANTNVNSNIVNANIGNAGGFLDALAAQRDALIQSLSELSQTLAALVPTNFVTIASNRATFDVAPDSNGFAVYSLTSSQLDTFGEIQFNRNGADTVIVNVSGAAPVLNDNFLGGTNNLGANVIWNFADATTLSLTTAWGGSVLAPFAVGTTSNYIQGSAVFKELYQTGEVHLDAYSGDYTPPEPPVDAVPEPTTWAMLLLGFGALGSIVRRRRSRQRGALLAA